MCTACKHLGLVCEYKRPMWWSNNDARRQHKAELGKQDGGKSLYDVLQANKGDFLMGSLSQRSPRLADIHG